MLTHLTLNNFVLIDALDQPLHPGLCVITGETGAGKSIMLTALGLVTGARVQPGLIGLRGDRADVTAVFDLPTAHPCQRILAEHHMNRPDGDQPTSLVLRRTLTQDGRTKAFVNASAVPVAFLASLGQHLVEIQGQFDQLAILNPSNHRSLLDKALGLEKPLADLATRHAAREDAAAALAAETERLAKLSEDQDYLRHCLQELDQAKIDPGEAETLLTRRQSLRVLSAAEDSLGQLTQVINGDRGLIDQLTKATKLASRLPSDLAEDMAGLIGDLDQAWNASESAAQALTLKLQDLGAAEQELEAVSERLFLLKDLARKHDCQPEDLLDQQAKIAETLRTLDEGQTQLRGLRRALDQATQAYAEAADTVSAARTAGATRLSAAIRAELPDLRLPEAEVYFELRSEANALAGPQGYDQVRLMAQTNPGAAPGPLEKVASGGELSRILLAFKLALTPTSGPGPLLVFDEADAGVGGATAAALGRRLRHLGTVSQVLAVTHSPQMAAAGHWHLKVTKVTDEQGAGTHITELQGTDRTQEIARMLAGRHIGQAAQDAARTLEREFAA